MAVAKKMLRFMEGASWIRRMFEEGARLKQIHGAENVFDFSLGNPNVPPPPAVKSKIIEVAGRDDPGMHGYMSNAGLIETREAIAATWNAEFGLSLDARHVVITCGAAGGLNIILKALFDPGDELIAPAPYFVEYRFYVDNHGGAFKSVLTNPDFTLDMKALEAGIGPLTKAVLINSPNNPTGQIYSEESLRELADLLARKSREYGRPIFLVSDEPYRKLVYNDTRVPCIFTIYPDSIITTSYSKDLSLAGERIGFVAVNPAASEGAGVINAMTLANRILGFVNAPGLMQRVVAELQGACVDVSIYRRKRDRLVQGLQAAGYELTVPAGAFYLFPRSPLADDVRFVRLLQEENVLVVPGSGFGGPGHFRIAYCVDDVTIEGALPGFGRALERARKIA